jgi:hypothetical protein
MKVITQDGEVRDNFAILLEITDAELAFIEEHPEEFMTLEMMIKLQASRGHNAHIVQLTVNDGLSITKYLSRLLGSYDSVSWFNREHKFHIRRNIGAFLN